MGEEIITFGKIEVKKSTIFANTKAILQEKYFYIYIYIYIYTYIRCIDINIDRIGVSNKVLFGKNGFEYFISYEGDSGRIMPLCIMLQKMSTFRRNFDETNF